MDASGIWTEMKFATMDRPDIKNNVIRLEISPAMEHTEDFTVKDWQQLWNDFAAAFDNQEILNEDGEVISVPTNISGSKSSVWLHRGIGQRHTSPPCRRLPDRRKREHQQRPRHPHPRTSGR